MDAALLIADQMDPKGTLAKAIIDNRGGGVGFKDADHLPAGWVTVTRWVRPYTDDVDDWHGPVVEENDDWLIVNVGFPMHFPKSRVTITRSAVDA